MRTKSYYIIQPNGDLIKYLSHVDALSREALDHDQLWESSEGGKSMWSKEDYATRAKFAFLINLRNEYCGARGVDQIFSEEKISVELFDKYWSIRSIELAVAVDEISNVILDSNELEFSGMDLVDEWLRATIRFK